MSKYVVNKYKEPYDVYIGRGSIFGNPFVLGKDGDRDEVCDKFERWVVTQPVIMDRVHTLKGKVLGCFCAPNRCHGDFLAKLANEE